MNKNQSSNNQGEADRQNIEDAIRILFEPGQVVEVRVPKAGKYGTVSGYFNDHEKLAEKLEQLSGKVGAVYCTLNPVNPALLARANNRARTYAKDTTSDAHDNIAKRNWLSVDCDPVRPAEISSTDEEKAAAHCLVPEIKKYLKTLGWADPVIADSGNGYHLLYKIDLPNDDESRQLLESVLKALAARFDTSAVKIDQKVFNASRITKAYGTKACKGDSIPERPHRLSKMFAPPECIRIVTRDLLLVLAAEAPKPEKKKVSGVHRSRGGWTTELVADTLDKADLNRGEAMGYNGATKWAARLPPSAAFGCGKCDAPCQPVRSRHHLLPPVGRVLRLGRHPLGARPEQRAYAAVGEGGHRGDVPRSRIPRRGLR
jgi:hypothetical protein